jgi:alpha-L-arabinofuranosidase
VNEGGLFLQTIYYPLQLFANNTKGKALELFVDAPKYKSRRFDDIPYLDASASYDNGSLVVNVVNRHKDQAIATEFELEDKQFGGAVEITEVNGPDIKAENSFERALVKPTERSTTAQGKMLRYSFPAHSYTMIRAQLVS